MRTAQPAPFAFCLMIIYDNIYTGDDLSVAEERNYLAIISNLQRAKEERESLIVMSTPQVFDLNVPNVYYEGSKPNS